MIAYICRQEHKRTILPFLRAEREALKRRIKVVSYEELFLSRAVPVAHLIFTDIDRLSVYEVEAAQAIANTLASADIGASIANDPARVLSRYSLLCELHRVGINSFQAARLDEGPITLNYPLFLRREDEALGPETDLLHSEEELHAAINAIQTSGKPLRGRLAVEYRAKRSDDGYFRKYSAFLVNGEVLPQHIQMASDWAVKSDSRSTGQAEASEELSYVCDNPHRDTLQRAFALANIDFGRIDYSIVDGRLEIYEINTNPTFSGSDKHDLRQERRALVRKRLASAFTSLDQPLAARGHIRFDLPRPRVHRLPAPRNPFARWVFVRRLLARPKHSSSGR